MTSHSTNIDVQLQLKLQEIAGKLSTDDWHQSGWDYFTDGVSDLIASEQLALLERLKEKNGDYYPLCLNSNGSVGSHCNKCWVCKHRNDDEYVSGYESHQNDMLLVITAEREAIKKGLV